MLEFFTYKRILALAILAVLFWAGLILYRVGREEVIKKVDFWKSKWQIVLFWFVVAFTALAILYGLNRLGLLDKWLARN